MREKKKLVFALAGNPNSGKTTLFNALTGANQHVGNYPGVTVERKEGELEHEGRRVLVIDLPGSYSLTAFSPDERVARNVLLKERPQVVIDVIDAGNLARNLYLATQLIEMKVPLVLAFNMMDEVTRRGIKIDLPQLSSLLGVPIVPTVGNRQEGIAALLDQAVAVAENRLLPTVEVRFGPEIDKAITHVQSALSETSLDTGFDRRWVATKLLEGDPEVREWVKASGGTGALQRAQEMKERLKNLLGDDAETLIADARWGWIQGAVAETVKGEEKRGQDISEKLDAVLVHRLFGFPIFLLLMALAFELTFQLGEPLTNLLELGLKKAELGIGKFWPEGLVRSLLVEGVLSGVGGVLVFVPNILFLFMIIAVMEDSGYMARAAFLVDRVMHLVGLHGKSFLPLFLGFGCNVPAILGARVLENERDRRVTILICPYISCSARLPVYVLLTSVFFSREVAGQVIFSLYVLGIVVAMVMAKLLRTLVVKGPAVPFVMELPPYRLPTLRGVLWHMGERAWMYVRKAGTFILALSVLVWFFSHFPTEVKHSPKIAEAIQATGQLSRLPPDLRAEANQERLAQSWAGRFGRWMAPALSPIGLGEWKVALSLLLGFAAKEVVVSTMGTLYSPGDTEEEGSSLREALKSDGFFTPLRAYAFMVFVLLYVPCLATLVVAYRELGSLKWVVLMVAMNLGVAYLMAGAVWWLGNFLGLQ